ncbi:NAD(P)-dependent oxidoreductase [Sulfitobacter sp. D35]|uniref:NAD(P)-dependent oxidoreductase n=1 Tax=Sulfitobacter sp. D35 TaxID=3083252 RepID=UPI00296E95EE|nr:NAD(P)-dependent oxidoreductase [Sulfitobacter sp. D35]MDW4499987.1 NAD(P)-dependent oxidoreductase [Sulfitobacter sp. D35]
MTSTEPRIGCVGLGHMGTGMALCLRRAGLPVAAVAHRNRAGIERLLERGGSEARDVADLLGTSDVLFSCLPNADTVAALVPDVLAHFRPGGLWIDTTTSDPAVTRDVARRMKDAGIRFADAPVTGGPPEAEAGTLASLVGCAETDWPEVEALTGHYSKVVRRFGAPGTGHSAKLLNNLVSQGTMILLAEAFGAARQLGVDWQALYDAMCSGAARSGTLEKSVGPALEGNFDGSRFTVRNAAKDLRYAAALLEDQDRPAADIVRGLQDYLERRGAGDRGDLFVSRLLDPEND